MPLGSSGNQYLRNPFALGGSMYGQNTTDAYNNGSGIGGNQLGNSGSTQFERNSYGAGGLNFGQPAYGTVQTAQNNNTQRQINDDYQKQLAARQAAPVASPTSSLLDSLLKGLTSGSGSSGGTPAPASGSGQAAVTSGIDTGPVWSPSQTTAGAAAINSGANATPPAALAGMGNAQGTLDRMFQDTMRQNSAQDATDFSRSAAYANAQQDLASQKAHAQSGLSSAELLARLQAQQYQQSLFQSGMQNNILQQLLGGLI